MKWLQLGNVRNMLMTVNIKLSIIEFIVIAEIIPSTDDTYYLKAFLLKMDRAKWTVLGLEGFQTVRLQITNVNPLLQYYRLFQLLLQPYAEQ